MRAVNPPAKHSAASPTETRLASSPKVSVSVFWSSVNLISSVGVFSLNADATEAGDVRSISLIFPAAMPSHSIATPPFGTQQALFVPAASPE